MPENETTAILYIYGGGFGFPSVDPKCLQLVYYLRMNPTDNIEIRVSKSSLNPRLPALMCGKKMITDFARIVKKIEKLSKPVSDFIYNARNRNMIAELKTLNKMLDTSFTLNCWGVKDNAEYFTDIYSMNMPTKLQDDFKSRVLKYNAILIRNIQLRWEQPLDYCFDFENKNLDAYFKYLSMILGQNPFMFGAKPSSYDAYLCGNLSLLLRYDFPKKGLQKILLKYERLIVYVRNFTSLYGGDDNDVEEEESEETESHYVPSCIVLAMLVFSGYICATSGYLSYLLYE